MLKCFPKINEYSHQQAPISTIIFGTNLNLSKNLIIELAWLTKGLSTFFKNNLSTISKYKSLNLIYALPSINNKSFLKRKLLITLFV